MRLHDSTLVSESGSTKCPQILDDISQSSVLADQPDYTHETLWQLPHDLLRWSAQVLHLPYQPRNLLPILLIAIPGSPKSFQDLLNQGVLLSIFR